MKKQILSVLLVLVLVVGILPIGVLAAGPNEMGLVDTYTNSDGTFQLYYGPRSSYAPSTWTGLGTIGNPAEDTTIHNVDLEEAGIIPNMLFQYTVTCVGRPYYHYCIDMPPTQYYIESFSQSGTGSIKDVYFSLEGFDDSSTYDGWPCLQLNYTGETAGDVEVVFKVNQYYNVKSQTGYCAVCGSYVSIPGISWLQTEITLHIHVNGEPSLEPAITGFEKERLLEEPAGLDLTDEISYDSEISIPSGGSVTLLYQLTVNGTAGKLFTVTDTGAKLVGSNCNATQVSQGASITGEIPTGGTSILYVTKSFTSNDVANGKVSNTASVDTSDAGGVADGEGDSTEETPATITYTLTYDANGGSGAPAPVEVAANTYYPLHDAGPATAPQHDKT